MLQSELFLGASNTNAPKCWSFKSLSHLPRFSAVIFGEDVAFGGVFRCTVGLRDKYGKIIIIISSSIIISINIVVVVYYDIQKLVINWLFLLGYVVLSLGGSRGPLIIRTTKTLF